MTKSIPVVLENAISSYDRITIGNDTSYGEVLRTLRQKLNLSQEAFAEMYGIPIGNVQNWEQVGRGNRPDTVARQMIEMIVADPDGVANIVRQVKARRAKRPPDNPPVPLPNRGRRP